MWAEDTGHNHGILTGIWKPVYEAKGVMLVTKVSGKIIAAIYDMYCGKGEKVYIENWQFFAFFGESFWIARK